MCVSLLSNLRCSKLNFSIQESPFSALVSIRKTFVKDLKGKRFPTPAPKPVEEIGTKQDELESVLHDLQIKLEKSKTEIIHLLAKNQEKDRALEKCDLKVKELQNELSNVSALQLSDMKGEVAKQVKPVVDEKRSLQIKHEQICAENKNLKEEKETLM